MFGFKIEKDYRNLPESELKRAYYDLSQKFKTGNVEIALLELQRELTRRNIIIGSIFVESITSESYVD